MDKVYNKIIKLDIKKENKESLISCLSGLLNIFYEKEEIKKMLDQLPRYDIIEEIKSDYLLQGIQKGEVIVSKESTVTEDIYQKLESLRLTYEDSVATPNDRELTLAGQFLLVGLIVTLLMVFLYLFRKDIFSDNRKISLILIIVTSMLVFLSWAIKLKLPSLYYIPFCIVPIIIRILFDTRLAMNIHLLVVLIASFFLPNSFEFAFLQITAGMVAIYSIKNCSLRTKFFML